MAMYAVFQELARAAELRRILDDGLVRSVYQPIVELDSGEVVGYEALARGPRGSQLELPDHLFAAAREAGAVTELEWACRVAAVTGALDAGLRSTLFINVEPSLLDAPMPPHAAKLLDRAREELDVVLELTERALTDRPAEMLSRLRRLRALGLAVALDDVGADARSLAFMPFVAPEVIKLDMRLVQARPDAATAAIVHAVNAQAERSGAAVLAEGIETPQQRDVAIALGARYGQGWLFGRPGPLPGDAGAGRLGAPVPRAASVASGAYHAVAARQRPRRGTKRLLLAISRHLEEQVHAQGAAAIVVAAFQDERHFGAATAARFARLARHAAFVGALGAGLDEAAAPGVRGEHLSSGDPLEHEWNVVVVAPHFAAAVVARDLGDPPGDDMNRRFDFCLTYDRELAIQAATTLLGRIAPLPQSSADTFWGSDGAARATDRGGQGR